MGEFHVKAPRLRTRWTVIIIVIIALAFGGIRACTHEVAPSAGAPGPPAAPVETATATQGDIGVYLMGLGAVTPVYTVAVHSRVDGQLMNVPYREGQLVREGDLLAEIDARPFQAQLLQAQGQLARDQALLAEARIDLARYQRLWRQDSVAKQIYDQQVALVHQDEGTVQLDQGQIDAAATNVDYCRITAPISGRLGLRLVDPGNIVHATDTTGIVVITQLQPITVVFTIAEDDVPAVYSRLNAGETLVVDAYDRGLDTLIATGSLLTIDNQIDPTTGTVKLKAVFPNEDGALFPNQFVQARLHVDVKRGVTLVPDAAVQRNADSTFTYVVKPDRTVTIRPVTVGTTEGGETSIDQGLAPGDVVVVAGMDKLQEGSTVAMPASGATTARNQ